MVACMTTWCAECGVRGVWYVWCVCERCACLSVWRGVCLGARCVCLRVSNSMCPNVVCVCVCVVWYACMTMHTVHGGVGCVCVV